MASRPIPTCRQGRATLRNVPATSLAEKFVPPWSRQPRRPPSRRGGTMSTPTPEREATQVFARRTMLKVGAAALVRSRSPPIQPASPRRVGRLTVLDDATRNELRAAARRDRIRRPRPDVVLLRLRRRRIATVHQHNSDRLRHVPIDVLHVLLRRRGPAVHRPSIRRPPRSRRDDRQIQRTRGHHLDRRRHHQTYITELHVRGDKVMFYEEYFDTYMLYQSLGLIDPIPA